MILYCKSCGAEIIESYSHCYRCRGTGEEQPAVEQVADDCEREMAALRKRKRAVNTRVWLALSIVAVLMIAVLVREFIYAGKYSESLALYRQGDYSGAAVCFSAIGDYRDAPGMVVDCNYCYSKQLMSKGEFNKAIKVLTDLGQYRDGDTLLAEARYELGKQYFELGRYASAIDALSQIADYRDSGQYIDMAKLSLISEFNDGQIGITDLLGSLSK